MAGKTTFDRSEYDARIAKLRGRLADFGVDAALFDEIEAMTWLSGYGNSENRWRCVLVARDPAVAPFFLIRSLDAGPCRRQTWIEDVPTFRDWENPFEELARQLQKRGLEAKRIGLDFNSYGMPLARFQRLKAALPNAEFVDVGPVVWDLRLIKSKAEIKLLSEAGRIADEAIRRVVAVCRQGVTQRKLAEVAVAAFVELGADPGKCGPISAGRGWDFLHAPLEDAPLAKGDVVHLELVPSVKGYSGRIMRCVSIGPPSAELSRAATALRDLQEKQIAAMRPGARARDVDRILREGVRTAGLRESFDNISGYTLGLYAPAGPRTSDFTRCFHPQADWVLEPGMVFHMYASAAGVSFSESVLVTESGPERLTKLERKLYVAE